MLVLAADPINDAPVLDLRLRKGIRRRGTRVAVAMPSESSLEASAALGIRFAPGQGPAFAAALAAALQGGEQEDELRRLAARAGAELEQLRELAALLRGPQEAGEGAAPREVVIRYGERLTSGPDGAAGAAALLQIAERLGLSGVEGAGLLELPAQSNARGLREAGFLPNAAPGLADPAASGKDAAAIAEALAAGDLQALYLLQSDPPADLPGGALWERALASASTVVAHASFLSEALREHASVVFPAEVYAEKEGTIVHPDGRVQRLRPAIARGGFQGAGRGVPAGASASQVRAGWQVISELALRLGLDLDVLSGAMASRQLFEAVPFYAGLTLEEIGGRGVRWQQREAASSFPAGASTPAQPPRLSDPADEELAARARAAAGLRSVWDAPEVLHSPALRFLYPGEKGEREGASVEPSAEELVRG